MDWAMPLGVVALIGTISRKERRRHEQARNYKR
jgi:hypothetical protein